MQTIPHLVGNPLEEVTSKQLNNTEIYVLGVKNPQSPLNSLYCINKENLFSGAFQDIDIDENTFNNPTFETSYQDMLPNDFQGLPDVSKIGVEYKLQWLVEFKRNPNFAEAINGAQFVTTLSGIRFMRYGISGVYSPWQLVTDRVIGSLQYMIANDNGTNYMGWLPLTGMEYARQQYPDLYALLKDKVTSTDNTFTLPRAKGHYLASSDDKVGQISDWTMPDLTDTIDLIKGTTKDKSLVREPVDVNKLFKIKGKDDSTTASSYLDDNVIKEAKDGNPTVGDDSGLTSEIKLDLKNKIGDEHVGDKIMPDTFFASNLYIYAGYPQV